MASSTTLQYTAKEMTPAYCSEHKHIHVNIRGVNNGSTLPPLADLRLVSARRETTTSPFMGLFSKAVIDLCFQPLRLGKCRTQWRLRPRRLMILPLQICIIGLLDCLITVEFGCCVKMPFCKEIIGPLQALFTASSIFSECLRPWKGGFARLFCPFNFGLGLLSIGHGVCSCLILATIWFFIN